jgi:hypothetical protein
MQTYTKLYHKRFPLWKKINRKMGKEAKIIYLYLLSSPFTHHSGLFEYNETMLVNTGLTFDEIEIGVSELLANGLITVDEQLEYCLITYLVENIKLDNPNQAKSLVKYLLDLEKTFLLGLFHQLIENTDTFNRIETVEEGLFNRYQAVVEPFANKDYTLYIKHNTLNTIDNKLNNKDNTVKKKNEKLETKITKEEKALLEKDAVSVYDYYKNNIKVGNRKKSISRLNKILKKKSYSELVVAIDNYKQQKDYEGVTNIKYIKTPENFFSIEDETYDNFLSENWINPYMLKEINELKSKSYNFKNGAWTEFGLNQVNDVKSRYNIISESAEDKDTIEVTDFKVVGG